ncbi:MAG TPA: cysteine desulfurase family protein [Chthoniobacterales bacterium]|nr:cysteine desulfurase family protein [Chthoniobacterales bacterium]
MIYLDYNATTPLCEPGRTAMLPFLEEKFGNPSSVHAAGREARSAIDDARDRLANLLGAKPHELIFTSGGTEANNLAILGLARSRTAQGKHLISAKTEHHAVLNAVEHLEKGEDFQVTWLDVSENGLIDLDQLADSIRDETVLVSVMHANNETGVIQPLREISELCRQHGVLLHSDMVQSFGKISAEAVSLADAGSFAAHKFYGPKGAGLLFLRSGISIEPIQFGGAHENQRRPGTENVAMIAGMAAAAEFVQRDREFEQERQRKLRDQLWRDISGQIGSVVLNGDANCRLANTLNVSLPELDSETMLMALDLEGVCASSGSACMVGSVAASHVLLAMGLPPALAKSAIRFSLGKHTTKQEISTTVGILSEIVQRTNARRRERKVAV